MISILKDLVSNEYLSIDLTINKLIMQVNIYGEASINSFQWVHFEDANNDKTSI